MLKKIVFILIALLTVFGLVSCKEKEAPDAIKVGTIAGPETQLMQVAKKVALKRFGLHVKIIVFSDYNIPNAALSDGSIDANAFQHIPFLKSQIKDHGYKIVSIGKTFLYPMGLYSQKIKSLKDLKNNSKVAVPNDPSNEARALLLLQKANLIQLKPGATIDATPIDIVNNPKNFTFIELDAAELPRALTDVAIAAINTNFAVPAGLTPSKALFREGLDSQYTNIIAARASDRNNPKLLELVKAYQSQPVINEAKKLFGDGAIPAWFNS